MNPTAVQIVMRQAHQAITRGFSRQLLTLVSAATIPSVSRSSIIGTATTEMPNTRLAKNPPTRQ